MISSLQQYVRRTFKNSCNCFDAQPKTGGATPPATGPRNRSWWYTSALPSGLWYYDYFMQQTLNSYFDKIIPPWCIYASVSQDLNTIGQQKYYYASSNLEYWRNLAYQKVRNYEGTYFNFPRRIGTYGKSTKTPIQHLFECRNSIIPIPTPIMPNIPKLGLTFRLEIDTPFQPIDADFNINCYRLLQPPTTNKDYYLFPKTLVAQVSTADRITQNGNIYLYIPISSHYIPRGVFNYFVLKSPDFDSGNPIPGIRTSEGTTENKKELYLKYGGYIMRYYVYQ